MTMHITILYCMSCGLLHTGEESASLCVRVCDCVFLCVSLSMYVLHEGHESRSGDNLPEKLGRDEGIEGQQSEKERE